MTDITLPRATVEQALEALERARPLKADYTTLEYFEEAKRKHYAAMAALRAALARQAEPVIDPFNCPKCGRHDYGLYGACPTCDAQHIDLFGYQGPSRRTRAAAGQTSGCDHCRHPLYAATKCRVCGRVTEQAEPVEPVGEVVAIDFSEESGPEAILTLHQDVELGTMLYTAPAQRKPLTEEEIDAVWDQWFGAYGLRGPGGPYTRRGFARAVERAHGITDTQVADRLARHGIQACLYPNCVGGQSGTVCHKHCPTPCTDCRGLGYDSSGQLCACQQNPSF